MSLHLQLREFTGILIDPTRPFSARRRRRPNGEAYPIAVRTGRRRAERINSILRQLCEDYAKSRLKGTEEGRRLHIEAIAQTLSLYRRRHVDPAKPADANALNEEEVEAMVLPAPGQTEEG